MAHRSTHSFPPLSRRAACVTVAALLAAVPALSVANDGYPNKPIRVVVAVPPGGATDALARIMVESMSKSIGQPMVVDNKPGAGGIIGTDAVAKAAPDGYTITLAMSNAILTNQFLYTKLPYNPNKDLSFIAKIADGPLVMAVSTKLPVKNATELVAYAKANVGKLSYGSYGAGSYAHLAPNYMSERTKTEMTHVAYKGEAPMLQDLLTGRIDFAFGSVIGMKQHVESGKLRFIGVTSSERMPALPNVPSLFEQGLKDEPYRTFGWLGFIAPAGTPKAIVDKLAAETRKAVQDPVVRERIQGIGFIPVADSTPEKFLADYKRDLPTWKRMAEISGVKLD